MKTKLKNKKVEVQHWGLLDYKEAWDKQAALHQSVIDEKIFNRHNEDKAKPTNNYLIFVEHPPVYTLGKSGNPEHLLLNEIELKEKGIQYFPNNRGGDITFHGPGQIVVYPIIDLDNFFTDIHKYLRLLEECVIEICKAYNIEAERLPGATGVWIDAGKHAKERKICALGIRCSRWVTMHGLAFNVNTDLEYFNNIIPCGIQDKAVTSLKQEVGKTIEIDVIQEKFKFHFSNIFDAELIKN